MQYPEIEITEYPVIEYKYKNGRRVSTYRKLRLALMERYKVCFWCKVPVKDYDHNLFVKGVKIPDDRATIDHIKQRPQRQKGENTGKVLACYKCNERRSKEKRWGVV